MKHRALFFMLTLAFLIAGCDNPTPTELSADGITPSATAVKKATPITFEADVSGPIPGFPNVINPECVTPDPSTGTNHFKKCIVPGTVDGDLVGTITAILNGSQDAAGDGRVRGFVTMDVCYDGICGMFQGPFKGLSTGYQVTMRGIGHGTGDFHTKQIRFNAIETTPFSELFAASGIIF
jgi:hypothetical protein